MNPDRLKPLPEEAERLLLAHEASARLVRHLTLVYNMCVQLSDALMQRWPGLSPDMELMAFGSAIHDIGKTAPAARLAAPGASHEEAGYLLLCTLGYPHARARFALTHSDWSGLDVALEDLIVAQADKIWKAKRKPDLEERLGRAIAAHTRQDFWAVYPVLQSLLDELALGADARIAWQG